MTATVNFSPSVTMSGSTPIIMDFDMDMAASISIDASGNVTMNPTFKMTSGTQSAGNTQAPESGGMQHLFGSVASFSGSSFTMTMMQSSRNLTFATNSSTHFDNLSGMGMMSNGMLIMVDAVMQADGTMLAHEVKSLMTTMGGMMAEGLVTGITGNPPSQLTMMAQNGVGAVNRPKANHQRNVLVCAWCQTAAHAVNVNLPPPSVLAVANAAALGFSTVLPQQLGREAVGLLHSQFRCTESRDLGNW